ncbi:unannotated protein [freshwater metagenome]|uniref:Unannotated protein n=1 Tax=freshwater metagenome TaxID=449393 RepID=A0A6J6EEL6_9ZZZZ
MIASTKPAINGDLVKKSPGIEKIGINPKYLLIKRAHSSA